MKLAKLLFKPKWQDKDASVRRAALAADRDPELAAALPEIARRDEDAGVRLAALQRLADYEAWRERSTGDADATVRNAAREAYVSLLCSGAGGAPPIPRRIAELETLSEEEIERVASSAADVALRREAIVRVGKQTLLAQRAAADPDASLRLALIERVTDATLLGRIAERTRKTDKAVSRRARERLQASEIATGDAHAISERARTLCERAESLMRNPNADAREQLNAIEAEWNSLRDVPAALSARFRGAHALAWKALEPRPVPVPEPAPAPMIEPPTPSPSPEPQRPTDNRAAEHARAERARQKGLRHEVDSRFKAFCAALDAGDTAAAHQLHAQLEAALATLAEVPRELREQLEHLQPRYDELKRWQHWSNNQRRRSLCTEIEALIDSGMHPDAVATRVREAREEWQRLNAAEGFAEGTEAAAGLSRRFHGVCVSALRPTRAYFSKRKEVRHSHALEIDNLVTTAAAITQDSQDWRTIAEIQSQATRALHALDSVEPRLRTQLARQLKDLIARMAALSAAHERDVEAGKARLIAQANALSSSGGATAARETRELQKQWTALGNGRRNVDQRQWREFRSACDAVFGKLDTARKEREEADATARAKVQAVLDEYAAFANESSADLEHQRRRLRELDARWNAVAGDDRTLGKRQRELREAIAAQIKRAERHRRLGRFSIAMEKYSALRASAAPGADASTLPACDFDTELAAGKRTDAVANEDAARAILVSLEFLAGVETPAEDRQLRMNHQVQRLSSRMREGTSTNPEQELTDLLKRWFGQGPLTAALEQRFVAAAKAAIESLP